MLDRACVLIKNHNQSVALFHSQGNRLLQALYIWCIGHFKLINHNLDIVILVAIHFHALYNVEHLTIYTDMQIAFAAHTLEQFAVMTFTTANEWCQDVDFMTGIVVRNHIQHTLFSVAYHLLACSKAIGSTGSGKEQTQIVVNLGGSTNC